MNKYEKTTFILLILGFVFSTYGSAYQIEQISQEEKVSCPTLFYAIKDQNLQLVRDLLEMIKKDTNVSLDGCHGDEFYYSLPEGSTLLHVSTYLDDSYSSNSIYSLLKRYRANEEVTDENGDAPLDIRRRMNLKRSGR